MEIVKSHLTKDQYNYKQVSISFFVKPWSPVIDQFSFHGSFQIIGSYLLAPIFRYNLFCIFQDPQNKPETVTLKYYNIRAKVVGSRDPYPIIKC